MSRLNFIHFGSSSPYNEGFFSLSHALCYVNISVQIHTCKQFAKGIVLTFKKKIALIPSELFALVFYSRAQYSGIDQVG